MLVFIRVYVCVKAKLTFVSYFLEFFLCTFPGDNRDSIFITEVNCVQYFEFCFERVVALTVAGIIR